ncbi:MAG: ABC transporter permease [Bdellovibrionota bacterium]
MIEIRDIKKSYRMGDNVVHALRGINLTIEDGDFVAIMGPSGSGKSTLTHILGLLDVPESGSYLLNGREVSKLSEDDLAVLRRDEIGFIFQQFNLLPRLNAVENVALPLLYSKKAGGEERSKLLMKEVGLDTRMEHRPNELSGGQQQRVAIARSLINMPRMILADEPTGNLDSVSQHEIMRILHELNDQGITVIVVTHEEEVAEHAKRLVRLRDGMVQVDERKQPLKKTEQKSSPQAIIAAKVSGIEILEYFRQGYKTLAGNKVRTALSMLGILIGVAAVVAMLAIGKGAQKAIESQLTSLGSNLLVVRAGAQRVGGVSQEAGTTTRLTAEDAAAIEEKVSTVRAVSPSVSGRVQVTHLNKNWSTQVVGAGARYATMKSAMPTVGRFFTDDENRMRSRVALVGATVVREVFGNANPVGEIIRLNKVSFQVIGVLPEKGATGFRDEDDVVVIPLLTAMHRLLGKNYVDTIDIEIKEANQVDASQEEILEILYARHRVSQAQQNDAFQVRNMAEIQAALTESSKTMSLLLASIAAISLLVGGIGIMNIMLVSVTERTKEIGLRKAIGARRIDILLQFLAESIVISVIGGLAGIFLGWFITLILGQVAGWATSISPESVVLAFTFSSAIGIVFGIYPARKASLLHPIEALRYE